MPDPINSSEATAIQAAYEAQVQTLFKSLITNLGDQHQTDQQCVDKFTGGLNIAKRARQLALNVVVSAVPKRMLRHKAGVGDSNGASSSPRMLRVPRARLACT
jgi:hypothetical protein